MGLSATSPSNKPEHKVRVMVVDDSAVIRGFLVRSLEREPDIEIAATCSNGQTAVYQLARNNIDVVILDIEMPVMDGLTALPKLLEIDSDVKVVIASTLSQRNAEISMRALALGAADYLPKPSASKLGSSEEFHRELLQKVRGLSRRQKRAVPAARPKSPAAKPTPWITAQGPFKLRTAGSVHPQILVIGSSTGGPQALMEVLKALPPSFEAPVLIAQHMPATFTPILAKHLAKATGRTCTEAVDRAPLQRGAVYLAPGDFHLEIAGEAAHAHLRLNKGPPENFCRPSVNPLLRSAVHVYGARAATVILTGMGNDGLEAAHDLAAAGGILVAQDEASSVVWGMPGAVAMAGLCTAVLPLKDIAPHVAHLFGGGLS